ncbi:DinB superfamily protein [Anatilimnocola aggregata]|uniref:DinB superfamily protein n=1 Tax=Anatilimnocola aggregata TaxID=2528021 RepID=A0A517YJ32_9BACT|nr:DinB family protein [Anatilimnocola aggregata]QDU30221.1 DinB superfamily protein [Anatilimnocola aggregata]
MVDQSLLAMFDEVRGSLLGVLQGVDQQAALWHPPGLCNHIVWHAGHALVVVEWLTKGPLGLEPEVPAGWFELFSWESKPADTRASQYPPLAIIVAELQAQHVRLRALYAGLSEIDLKGRPLMSQVAPCAKSSCTACRMRQPTKERFGC